MYDVRIDHGTWIRVSDAIIFTAKYNFNVSVASLANPNAGYKPQEFTVEIVFNPDDYTKSQIEQDQRVRHWLTALGRIPSCLFKGLTELQLMAGDDAFSVAM